MSEKAKVKNSVRAFLATVFFGLVIYLLIRNITVFGNLLLAMFSIGVIVLVHEFGHFVVAKVSDIKVEAFWIFMPPMLLGIRRTADGVRFRILPKFFPKENDESGDGYFSFTVGKKGEASETEYRIGLIPFGGFVKMLGQEDIGPVKSSDDPRSYSNKPVGVRMGVISAGVIFNALSALIVFMIVFLIGIRLMPAVVGGVVPGSPAARAGLKAGDEIIAIDGKDDNLDFSSIAIAAALSDRDEEVVLKVRHSDGSIEDFGLVAEQSEGEQMKRFGVSVPMSLTIAKVSDADALVERTGLLAGDCIKSVNGRDVQSHWQLEQIVQDAFVPEVTILAERTGTTGKTELVESRIRLTLDVGRNRTKTESGLGNVYCLVPRMRIGDVSDELKTSGTEISLKSGDVIVAVGDVENPTYEEMREVTEAYEDKELPIKVLRLGPDGDEKSLTVTVVPERRGKVDKVMIGIGIELDVKRAVVAKTVATKQVPVALSIPRGALITAVSGVSVTNFLDIAREIGRYGGQQVTINYLVDEQTAGDVSFELSEAEDFVPVKSTFAEPVPFEEMKKLYKAGGPVEAIVMGYKRTVMFIVQTYLTLKRLVSGLVSPKLFRGPVGIIAMSYYIVAERPLVYYFYFIGLISACIAVVNFLPLLPFDGGHIVFLLIEKIKGSAVSERVLGAAAYAGWVLVGALFLYVTFNDVVRTLFG